MSKKIYVGNLPFQTTDEDLKSTFGAFGEVTSANVIMDKFSGKSRGFGFVEMSADDAADKAVAELNGTDLGGRKIVVNEARPQEKRERTGFGGGGGGGGGGRGRGRGGFGGGRSYNE